MRSPTRNRAGWFLVDAITGLGIVTILALALANVASHYRKGTDRLGDSRQAVRLAEQTMLSLQSGQPAPTPPEGDALEIAPLEPAKGMPGCSWVRVSATHNGRVASLVGIVKSESAKGAKR